MLARVIYALVFCALLVVGFFFFTVALIVGAVVALAILGRFWWVSRKLRRAHGESPIAREGSAIEGEFTVVERRETVERIEK